MILWLISIYSNRVRRWLGNTFLWPFSVSIHWRSRIKKRSHDPDVVGQVKNGTCQASEKMQYVNVEVHDNRCLFGKRE